MIRIRPNPYSKFGFMTDNLENANDVITVEDYDSYSELQANMDSLKVMLDNGKIVPVPQSYRDARTKEEHENSKILQMNEINLWFAWYDVQASQAVRAERIGDVWDGATDADGTRYVDLLELDIAAGAKQKELRALKKELT